MPPADRRESALGRQQWQNQDFEALSERIFAETSVTLSVTPSNASERQHVFLPRLLRYYFQGTGAVKPARFYDAQINAVLQ